MRKLHALAVALTFLLATVAVSQTQSPDAPPLRFDSAKVKPENPIAALGFAIETASRIHYPRISLLQLLMRAYDLADFQVQGPDWLRSVKFDIDATMPPQTTQSQLRLMLQSLLVETKRLPTYALAIAEGGPRFAQSTDHLAGRAGIIYSSMGGNWSIVFTHQTTQDLVNELNTNLATRFRDRRSVTDATGLTESYDFALTLSPEPFPDIDDATAEQKLSLQEFHARYDGEKPYYEYWDGVVVQKSKPTRLHSLIQKILVRLLDGLGLDAGAEVTLKLDPAYEPIPDVIAADGAIGDPYPTAAFEVLIEILSPQDSFSRVLRKCRLYEQWGIRQVVVIDPLDRLVRRYESGKPIESEIVAHRGDAVITAQFLWDEVDRELARYVAKI